MRAISYLTLPPGHERRARELPLAPTISELWKVGAETSTALTRITWPNALNPTTGDPTTNETKQNKRVLV